MGQRDQPLTPDAGRSTGAGEGNQNRVTHGHVSAIRALRDGRPLVGPAAEMEHEVRRVYLENGAFPLQEDLALKMATVALVLADAISALSQDEEKSDSLREYAGTFGSIASKAFGMLDTIRVKDADAIEGVLSEAIETAKEIQRDKNS